MNSANYSQDSSVSEMAVRGLNGSSFAHDKWTFLPPTTRGLHTIPVYRRYTYRRIRGTAPPYTPA